MPFSFDISPSTGVTMVTVRGSVDLRSSVRAMDELSRHPQFDPSYPIVVDLREMGDYPASRGELSVLAWALRHDRSDYARRVAVVLPEGREQERVERIRIINELSDIGLSTFLDMDQARAWLVSAAS